MASATMIGSAPGMTIEENLAMAAGSGGWFSFTGQRDKKRFQGRAMASATMIEDTSLSINAGIFIRSAAAYTSRNRNAPSTIPTARVKMEPRGNFRAVPPPGTGRFRYHHRFQWGGQIHFV